ncbi:MAG: hypothetical protein AAB270_01450, partial [Chloroflexota bacterium]
MAKTSSPLFDGLRTPLGRGTVLMPGTCGELVQGTLEGVPFHVSCPIDLFARVSVEIHPFDELLRQAQDAVRASPSQREWPGVSGPDDCPKAQAAVRACLASLGLPRTGIRGKLQITSSLPRGKGMASSTADVAGAILATAEALGREIDTQEVARLAVAVEPTDGSLFPGIALFAHRGGSLYQDLGPPLPLSILALDCGGEVDTLAFNAVDRRPLLRRLEPQTTAALEMVRQGLALRDIVLLGEGATLSAVANQEVLYKPQLEAVMKLSREIGALGVNVGHSGTIIGVLLAPDAALADAEAYLKKKLPGLGRVYRCHLIGGGPLEGGPSKKCGLT